MRNMRCRQSTGAASRALALVGPIALLVGAVACGDPGSPTATGSRSAEVSVEAVYEDLSYYGACGNETLTIMGTTYYPLFPEERQDFDPSGHPVVEREALETSGFVRVAPPGPGDDIGTLVVYSDGMARFESDSGWVIWLTTTTHQYDWVC